MNAFRRAALAALLTVGLVACGSGSGDDEGNGNDAARGPLNVQVASFDVAVGPPSRFIVGLLTADDRLVGYGTVQVRFAYLGTKERPTPTPPGPPQRAEYVPIPGTSVPSPPPAAPELVSGADARGVYATQAGFDRPGFWQAEVSAAVGGVDLDGTAAFEVRERRIVPGPGDPAPPVENHTVSSPDVPKVAVDSRAGTGGEVPDPELHDGTVAAALAAGRPVVVVIATPVYCQSRFCGPVTDMVQQLSHTYGDRAEFIHIEVWRDYEGKVVNKAAADWIYPNKVDSGEPWVFVVGADGRIIARFDNVATQGELESVLQQLPVIGPA